MTGRAGGQAVPPGPTPTQDYRPGRGPAWRTEGWPLPEIHRLPLPTPFPVGPVNTYVLPERPVTLVDPGPVWDPAREALLAGLAHLGLALKDIDLIVITPPHIDHYGLANEVAAASGAVVAAHPDAAPRLAVGLAGMTREGRGVLEELLTLAGAPETFGEDLLGQWTLAAAFAHPVRVDRFLPDGEVLEGGGVRWTAVHTPGHSPGSVCLYEPAGGRLVSGDHLLFHITSNAIIEFEVPRDRAPAGGPAERLRSLEIYIGALRRLETLDVSEVLPGHGEPFGGHREVITGRLGHYETRKAEVLAALDGLGPSPAFRLAEALFPDEAGAMGRFLALSEILGHLDLLETEGRVVRQRDGRAELYRSV